MHGLAKESRLFHVHTMIIIIEVNTYHMMYANKWFSRCSRKALRCRRAHAETTIHARSTCKRDTIDVRKPKLCLSQRFPNSKRLNREGNVNIAMQRKMSFRTRMIEFSFSTYHIPMMLPNRHHRLYPTVHFMTSSIHIISFTFHGFGRDLLA